MDTLKKLNRLLVLSTTAIVVRIIGYIADVASAIGLIYWIVEKTPMIFKFAIASDMFLFGLYGVLSIATQHTAQQLFEAEEANKD